MLKNGHVIHGADAISGAVPYIRRVRDSRLALVGLGRIGSAVAVRAKACGFDVPALQAAEFTLTSLKDAGFGVPELKAAGASLAELWTVRCPRTSHPLCDTGHRTPNVRMVRPWQAHTTP